MRLRNIAIAAGLGLALPALAAGAKPEFYLPGGDGSTIIHGLSDNGRWAINEVAGGQEGNIFTSGGQLIDLTTKQTTPITHYMNWAGVSDVTDDGSIVVGEAMGLPAYYTTADATWHTLPLAEGWQAGRVECVTPDGRYAAGMLQIDTENWNYIPALWDLTTGELLETPGLDITDKAGLNEYASKFSAISPDGSKLVTFVSWFFPMTSLVKIYDRESQTTVVVGYDKYSNGYKAQVDNLIMCDFPTMSPNGEWVTGHAQMGGVIDGFEQEFAVPFRYHVTDGAFEVYYNDPMDADKGGAVVLNDGTVIACTPAMNPCREAQVRYNGYWYDLNDIYGQVYGVDVKVETGLLVSGNATCVTADGLTMALTTWTTDNYMVTFPEALTESCQKVDLLGNWSTEPAAGSVFSSLANVKVRFTRNIGTAGQARNIKLLDGEGNELARATNMNVSGAELGLTFARVDMEPGKDYTVFIPAGFVTLAGDAKMKAGEIRVTYTGRRQGAVEMTDIYPAEGTYLAKLNMTESPVLMTFDADVALASGVAYLYRNDEGEPFCELQMVAGGNQVLVFPALSQNLFKDSTYRMVIPAGSITDISGQGACETIDILYNGSYVQTTDIQGDQLFFSDCKDYEGFLFYEGDKRQPQGVPAGWGFSADTTPWYVVRASTESTDMALGSHSMYAPAGQADDWMIIHQLRIPDDTCELEFDAQSYLKSKQDHLKLYVLAEGNVVSTANDAFIEKFRTEGKLLADLALTPGESEEDLEGDWEHYVFKLSEYAGQDIYIAFVNDNYDQSAVFVDNILVRRDLKYAVTFQDVLSVENLAEMEIRPVVTVFSESDTFTAVTSKLLDAQGNELAEHTATGLELKKGDSYKYSFSVPLPLTVGENNAFSVSTVLTDKEGVKIPLDIQAAVKDLAFTPVKRIVLEEFTGHSCVNCPQGIVAIENLQKLYGDQIIPIAVKGYGGNDPLGLPVMDYSDFLGMKAAPSGRFNRGPVEMPMVAVDMDYRFSGAGLADENGEPIKCWMDVVGEMFETPAECEISAVAVVDDNDGQLHIKSTVRSALNMTGQSLSVFAVLLEDQLLGVQLNGMYTVNDPDLGEWGAGGIYGKSNVVYNADHVARATYGKTFNGTSGLIPAKLTAGREYTASLAGEWPSDLIKVMENCHVVVMLIDSNTGLVVNSCAVPVDKGSGVGEVSAPSAVKVQALAGGMVAVDTPEAAQVEVYDMAGRRVGAARVEGGRTVVETAARGVAVVRVVTNGSAVARKVVLK